MSGLNISDLESGGKSWTPEEIGDKISGKIALVERRQQRDFTTGDPLNWDDGSPRLLTYIELQTDERDPEIEDDQGIRALYAKGGNYDVAEGKGQAMEKAIVAAVKAAGAKSIDEGAKLTVAQTGRAKATVRGYQPARLYTAKYEAPTASVDVDDLFSDDD